MRRNVCLFIAMFSGLAICGCEAPGWTRAIGHFPGIAPGDYAFYEYCGTSSQVFQFPVPQVQGAAVEALRDLGFKQIGPTKPCTDEAVALTMSTPDGRPATVTLSPQNTMTNMRINIGPVHIGDEILSREVFRRVALNFGTLPRNYMPLEPTLARRTNHPATLPPRTGSDPPETLEGEGLRPGETHTIPSPEFTAPVTGAGSGLIAPPFDPFRPSMPATNYPNSPYLPYAPFPYNFAQPGDFMYP
jgi:hypothetical protein